MRFVIKIGGHLLDEGATAYTSFSQQIKTLAEAGHRIAVVVGGGSGARIWIDLLRKLGATEAALDEVGIMVSRINAFIMIQLLNQMAHPVVPENLREFDAAWGSSNLVVMGGLTPGQSTSAVAAILAERTSADRLIVLTNVDGVYTDDPSLPSSKFLSEVSIDELSRIISNKPALAGTYFLVDDVFVKIMRRSRTPAIIANGLKNNILIDATLFRANGTVVTYP